MEKNQHELELAKELYKFLLTKMQLKILVVWIPDVKNMHNIEYHIDTLPVADDFLRYLHQLLSN